MWNVCENKFKQKGLKYYLGQAKFTSRDSLIRDS